MQDCFDLFDRLKSVASQDFHVAHLVDFNRAAAELRLAVNRFLASRAPVNFRKRLAEAISKLENMKSLQHYDGDATMHILLAEVDVNILLGNCEEVFPLIF